MTPIIKSTVINVDSGGRIVIPGFFLRGLCFELLQVVDVYALSSMIQIVPVRPGYERRGEEKQVDANGSLELPAENLSILNIYGEAYLSRCGKRLLVTGIPIELTDEPGKQCQLCVNTEGLDHHESLTICTECFELRDYHWADEIKKYALMMEIFRKSGHSEQYRWAKDRAELYQAVKDLDLETIERHKDLFHSIFSKEDGSNEEE